MTLERVNTTFASDFEIAERISGLAGVKDTYKRAFEEWKGDIRYICEMYLVINAKTWEHHAYVEARDKSLKLLHDKDAKFCEAIGCKVEALENPELYNYIEAKLKCDRKHHLELQEYYTHVFYVMRDYVYSDEPRHYTKEEVGWFFDVTD